MLRALLLIFALASVVAAEGHAYLQPGDRISFCGVSKDERRLDLVFLQTYVATRFPDSEIVVDYSPANPRPQVGKGATFAITLLLTATSLSSGTEGAQTTEANCRIGLKEQPSATRMGLIAFEDPIAWPQVRSFDNDETPPATEFHLWQTPSPPDPGANAARGLVAALQLLQLWNVPASVSSVEINLLATFATAENTTVRELAADRFIGWTQDERALPLPLALVSDVAPLSGPVRSIDVQTLRVIGAPLPRYALTIDGERIAVFTKDELERGVNLALLATPMARQAGRVLELVRSYVNSNAKERGHLMEELRSAAKPQTHDYELQPLEDK